MSQGGDPDLFATGQGAQVWPRRVLGLLCALILLAMVALTVVDVLGRYLLNAPLLGATELTELLLVAVVFVGLPAVCLDDAHVRVDLLTSLMPMRLQPWRQATVALVTAVVLGVVAWRLWLHGVQIGSYGAVTNSLRLPVAPVAQACALTCASGALVTLWGGIAALRDHLATRTGPKG